MTPEQEVVADQLGAIRAVVGSAQETLPLIGRMPAGHAEFEGMTTIQKIAATAMLKEFEQLEGLLSSLFRAVLRSLGVRLKGLYPLDVANRMSELQVLDDPKRWLAVVKLRNELVHEYPLGTSERYDRFSAAFDSLPFLFETATRAERLVAERRLLDSNP